MSERIHLNALQTYVYQTLIADAGVQSTGAEVYDDVPENAALPYVEVGEYTQQGEQSKDGNAGSDVVTTLHAYSAESGSKQLNAIMDAVLSALTDTDPSITLANGARVARGRHDFSEAEKDYDEQSSKLYRHGMLRIRWLMLG